MYVAIMVSKTNNFHCSAARKILKRKILEETSRLCWIIKQFYRSGLKESHHCNLNYQYNTLLHLAQLAPSFYMGTKTASSGNNSCLSSAR